MGGVGSGRRLREYPAEIVQLVCDMYRSGMTVAEIRAAAPKGYRVQTILERHIPERRNAAKRSQVGEANHMWRGDEASYQALHMRVEATKGKPQECSLCGCTEGRMEWANLTGDYADVNDYARMCVPCHRNYDAARRRTTGRRTSPNRR